jgi:hypothetical protein
MHYLSGWRNGRTVAPLAPPNSLGQKQIHQALAEAVVLFRGLTQLRDFLHATLITKPEG